MVAEIFHHLDRPSNRRDGGQKSDGNFFRDDTIHDDVESFLVHLLDELDEIFQSVTSLEIADWVDAVAVDVNFVMDVRSCAEARRAHVSD